MFLFFILYVYIKIILLVHDALSLWLIPYSIIVYACVLLNE